MRNWLKVHRVLLGVALAALAVNGLFAVIGILPLRRETAETREKLNALESTFRQSHLPMDVNRLAEIHQLLTKRLDGKAGVRRHAAVFRQRADQALGEWVTERYGKAADLEKTVTRLDLQQECQRVAKELQKEDIFLPPELRSLGEGAGQPVYQSLLQIRCVWSLAELARRAGLSVAKEGDASRIQVNSIRSYSLDDKDLDKILMEFPVQMELMGSLEQIRQFLASLLRSPAFFPLRHVELSQQPESGVLHATVTCSGFWHMDRKGH